MKWPDAVPLAPLAMAFAGGVASAAWLPSSLPWVTGGGAIAVTAALLWAARHRAATLTLLAAILSLGAMRAAAPSLPAHHLATMTLPPVVRLEGRIAAEPRTRSPDHARILLDTDTLVTEEARRRVTGRVQISLSGATPPITEGQRVAGAVRVYPPRSFRNPGAFDFRAYLARRGVYLVGSGRGDRLVALEPARPPWRVRVKRWALDAVRAALPRVSATLLGGLLLGDHGELPPEVQDAFRRAGVYHVLAVSGFNVALLAAAVFTALSLARLSLRVPAGIAIVVVVGFAFVVGPEPSVLRAGVMAVLLLFAVILARESAALNSVAVAAVVILAARPGDLLEPGFQLSFGATLGILLFAPPVRTLLVDRGFPRWLAEAIGVSASAQLAVTPIMLTHFNQLSVIGVLANLLVVPLAAVATVVGMLAVSAAALHELAGQPLFDGVWLALLALRGCVYVAARVPAAMIHLPAPPWIAICLFYTGLGLLLWRLELRRRGIQPSLAPVPAAVGAPATDEGRSGLLRRPAVVGAVAGAMLAVAGAIELWPWVRPPDGRLRVTVLDVGQGDAIVVELPDGRTALIDAGPGGPSRFDAGERVVAPFLWNRGIRRLAVVVPTHDDADHAGGLPAILRLFRVDEVWSAAVAPTRRWFGNVPVTVLNPRAGGPEGSPRGRAADRNNRSIVLRIDHGLFGVLLTADIEREAEEGLAAERAPLRVPVLKVAHHGGRRSTGARFLAAARPAVAIISVGARNPFGHPAPETLTRLGEAGTRIYRTDEDGAVTLTTDGRVLEIGAWADRRTERYELYPSNERSI